MERPEFSSEISIAKSEVKDVMNNIRDRNLHYFLGNRMVYFVLSLRMNWATKEITGTWAILRSLCPHVSPSFD